MYHTGEHDWQSNWFIIIIIYSLTARVVGAPQMISQPVSSIFFCSPLPSGIWRTPGLFIPWRCLSTTSSLCLVICPLSLCLTRCFLPDLMIGRRDYTTAVCVSLPWSGGLRGPIACWILAQTSSVVTWSLSEMRSILLEHLIFMACILLWSSAVRVHDSQAYRKMDVTRERISRVLELRNTHVIPNWFQPCRCCWCLCYPGESLRIGTLVSYNWAQVLEACDSLKLLSIYFYLCVDATGVVCHQLGLLGTNLHAVVCSGFVKTFN